MTRTNRPMNFDTIKSQQSVSQFSVSSAEDISDYDESFTVDGTYTYTDNEYDTNTLVSDANTLDYENSTVGGSINSFPKYPNHFENDEESTLGGNNPDLYLLDGYDGTSDMQATLHETLQKTLEISERKEHKNDEPRPTDAPIETNLEIAVAEKRTSSETATGKKDESLSSSFMRTYSNLYSVFMVTYRNSPKYLQVIVAVVISTVVGSIFLLGFVIAVPKLTSYQGFRADSENMTMQGRGGLLLITLEPSPLPSSIPSADPTSLPSYTPTPAPSVSPSASPSASPTISTLPTKFPTKSPTTSPTRNPTPSPTKHPSFSPSSSPTYTPITFYVLGDIPYDIGETSTLYSQITQIPTDADFVVFTGDMQNPALTNCTSHTYTLVNQIMRRSTAPVFMLPGDNDWKECVDPVSAWSTWKSNFLGFENNWSHSFGVQRQANRMENFSFYYLNVLFVGVNIPGGDVYNKTALKLQLSDNLKWLTERIEPVRDEMVGMVLFCHGQNTKKYSDFFKPFVKMVEKLEEVPTLYIHGGGRKYYREKRVMDVKNLIEVQIDNGGDAAPLRVRFLNEARRPFEFY